MSSSSMPQIDWAGPLDKGLRLGFEMFWKCISPWVIGLLVSFVVICLIKWLGSHIIRWLGSLIGNSKRQTRKKIKHFHNLVDFCSNLSDLFKLVGRH